MWRPLNLPLGQPAPGHRPAAHNRRILQMATISRLMEKSATISKLTENPHWMHGVLCKGKHRIKEGSENGSGVYHLSSRQQLLMLQEISFA